MKHCISAQKTKHKCCFECMFVLPSECWLVVKCTWVSNFLSFTICGFHFLRFSRSVPLLKSLHWLPVRYRIIFKICTITYQALSTNLHIYIQCSLQQDSPDSFSHLVPIYFLFLELKQTLELKLFWFPHQLCGIHS